MTLYIYKTQYFFIGCYIIMAEEVGFEPTDACTSPVFKTGALSHSATLPFGAREGDRTLTISLS